MDENSTTRHTFIYNSLSSLSLDVIYNKKCNGLQPVLVYIHGGSWWEGDKSEWSTEKANYLLSNGIISVAIDYTLAQDPNKKTDAANSIYPQNIEDIVNSIEWVKQNISKYDGDPNNIFIMGYSAGAYLAALVVNQNRVPNMKHYIKGVICLDAGPYLVMDRPLMKKTNLDTFWINAFGEDNFKNEDLNPMYLITKNDWLPPFFLICGTAVERKNSNDSFHNVMLENTHISDLVVVPKITHQSILYFVENNLPFKGDLINFIKTHSTSKSR